MDGIRRLYSYVVLALLTLGYLASVFAAMTGTAEEYARRVDQPSIRTLSLVLFLGALLLALFPAKVRIGPADSEGDP